jgi:GxxExxY protein
MMAELLMKEEVYRVVGAAMEVINEFGSGFLEPVYQEAMGIELRLRDIPFAAQVELQLAYKGVPLQKKYVADLICFGCVLVELKALDKLTTREMSQVLNYLKATGIEVGVLINFGADGRLEWRRIVRSGGMRQFRDSPQDQEFDT